MALELLLLALQGVLDTVGGKFQRIHLIKTLSKSLRREDEDRFGLLTGGEDIAFYVDALLF